MKVKLIKNRIKPTFKFTENKNRFDFEIELTEDEYNKCLLAYNNFMLSMEFLNKKIKQLSLNPKEQKQQLEKLRDLIDQGYSINVAMNKITNQSKCSRASMALRRSEEYLRILNTYMIKIGKPREYVLTKSGIKPLNKS
jgi:hypothetical protein